MTLAHTKQLAEVLAGKMKGGEIIFLKGNLGVGKTTFVKFFAEALGSVSHVKSPTFTYVWSYPVPKRELTIYHYDLYRMESADPHQMGLTEVWGRPDAITIIEWAERLVGSLPVPRTEIQFEFEGDGRLIKIADSR